MCHVCVLILSKTVRCQDHKKIQMKRRMYCVVNDVLSETSHMFMYRTFNIAAMIAAVRTTNLISLISSNEVNCRSGLLLFITIYFF